MKRLKKLEWLFDYWVLELRYGPYGNEQYREFMWRKWGDRYSEAYIKEVYVK